MSVPVNNNAILSVRHYQVTPPDNLVIPIEEVIPTSREEEIITKKKTELTTTKQIQTRVKRQVVLEDGKVVEDSGPIVTTNTTEDTAKHEEQNTEHRNIGDGEKKVFDEVDKTGDISVLKEIREKKIKSREEKEERLETEQVAHLGNISDDLYLRAVQSNATKGLKHISNANTSLVASTAPRIIHQSAKIKKVTDTEDSKHISKLAEDGKLLTQSETTVQHEEVNDTQEPCEEDIEDHESVHETSHHYKKTKDQDTVEYYADGKKIGEQVKFQAENFTGAGTGNQDSLNFEPIKWDTLSERIRKLKKNASPNTTTTEYRPDAITQKPLDVHQEEQSKRSETSKWLENHFGSESSTTSSTRNSVENGPTSNSRTTSFINVTMKSTPPTKSVSPTKLIVTPKETTIITPSSSSPFYRGISEWKSGSNSELKDDALSSTSEWKKETDTSSEWRKVSEKRNTSLLSDGSEVKKSMVEEHTRVNRVIPIQLYRTNSSQDVTTNNSISYKPDLNSGSLSSLPIYAEVNKKRTRFAPDPTPISRNPDPTDPIEKSKSDYYNRKLSNNYNNNNNTHNNEHDNNHNNNNTNVKRKNSTKRASLTESFKKFIDKLKNGSKKGKGQNDTVDKSKYENEEPIVPPRSKHRNKNKVQKYYLGEDPYGSMYGKEKEYDSVTVYRDRPKNGGGTLPRRHHHNGTTDQFDTVTVYKRKEPNTIIVNRGGIQTLPRKSTTIHHNSTSSNNVDDDFETVTVYRSRGNSQSDQHRGGIQTLPRKNKVKDVDQMSTTSNNSNINVFIVNKRSSLPSHPPPAKPTRTYRTNLLRSQSFNVQPNIYTSSTIYKSNPHLDILEEDVAPLKSPSIISNINNTNNIRYHHTSLRS